MLVKDNINEEGKKFINEFYELHPDRKILFLVKAGSHFFDLNSANSDTDYRGIYLPSLKEFYEGESNRRFYERKTLEGNKTGVKNTKEDTDLYLFSLTFFLDLLKRGDFNCMELLHAPEDKILINSDEIKFLTEIRQSLLVNDISAFLGFIKKEYRRYGVNINHYKIQQDFANFLKKYPENNRLVDIWKDIKEYAKKDNQIIFTTSLTGNSKEVPTVKIAQRLYQNTVKVGYVVDAINERADRYGHRQKAMANSGVEFKGLYHALRLIYEANDLFDFGEFNIPFNKERYQTLRTIKDGTASQEFIFDLIDKEIENLYNREKNVKTNKHIVSENIERILSQLVGRYKIEYIVNINKECYEKI